ncbi:dynamin family protein [Terrisporobacter sp.]
MFFNKKALSKEFKLEEILFDINNIAHANPNAALSQLRTFIDVYIDAVLTYENMEVYTDLANKINTIKKYNFLTEEEIDLIHQIRKTGNNAVHKYYSSVEEVMVYLQVCNDIYEKFISKYESDRIDYKKKLMKTYRENLLKKNEVIMINKVDDVNKKNDYKGKLISEDNVIIANESINIANLNTYANLKNRLIRNIDDVKSINIDLGIEDEQIDVYKDNIINNKFNLIVLGEFNRGKSTFLNALLGKVILPSNILPTTSVITRISYSDEPKVKVVLNTGEEKKIDYDELINYVTNLNGNKTESISITDVYYPISLCKNGCIITDTPGVNDLNEQNIEITESYIPEGDAVIFILDPNQVFTKSEKEFIKNKVLKNDIHKIFFIVNKFDTVNREGLANFKNYVNKTIKELNLSSKVYYLSSSKSLKCKINNTTDEYLESFNEFCEELEKFLIEEKGRYLLINGCKRLNTSIQDAIKYIYNVEKDLNKDIDTLQKEYDEFVKIENKVNENKFNIMTHVDNEYMNFKTDVKKIIYTELSSSFDKLINDINLYGNVEETYLKELENKINFHINSWINKRVNPFILARIDKINNQLISLLSDSLKYVSQLDDRDASETVNEIAIVQSCKFELPTCYNTVSTNNNEKIFMGAGAILAVLFTGTLLSGIGGAMLGVIANMFYSDNKKVSSTKDEIFRNIEKQKNLAINSIMTNIENCIDKSYKQNCRYVDNSIQSVLQTTSNRMNVILNEKKRKNSDMQIILDNLNDYLKKLYLIKKHNDLIIKSIEE